ncbi:MAG: hypothetical protein WBW92_05560 [Rhodanobacteraceae bacterium]
MKYFALMGLLILVAVLGLGVRLATEPPQDLTHGSQLASAEVAQVKGDPAAINRDILQVRRLDAQLESIEARAFESRSNTSLIAYSRVNPADQARLAAADDADKKPQRRQARVSLLYSGQDFNRAVVDGKYVRRGDRLPGGGRVLRISENSVLVRTGRHRHLLHVPEARQISRSGH